MKRRQSPADNIMPTSPTMTDTPNCRTAFLSLGSNMGDRLAMLRRAVLALSEQGMTVVRVSPVYQTAPMYVTDQPAFLNMAVAIATDLTAENLLDRIHRIESAAGRVRSGERNGPRPLDIDIVCIEGEACDNDRLTLPHPRLHERAFVLAPLADITRTLPIPDFPPVRSLLAQLGDPNPPARFAAPPAASRAVADTYTISLRDFRGALTGLHGAGLHRECAVPLQLQLQVRLTVSHPGAGFPDDIAAVMSYETVVEALRDLCATASCADADVLALRAADLCLTCPPVHRARIAASVLFPMTEEGYSELSRQAEVTLGHA